MLLDDSCIVKALDSLLSSKNEDADDEKTLRIFRTLLAKWRGADSGVEQLLTDDDLLAFSRAEVRSGGEVEFCSSKTVEFLSGGGADEDFVLTEKLSHALLLIDMLTRKGVPVLLQGPICSGKTSLLSLYAKINGRANSVRFTRLQLHDQMDGKSLIGNYVVGEEPGQFIWQPGPLTEAVCHGYWLLLEDLDAASADALSAIVHLAEFRSVRLPNCSRPLVPHPDFRLFATLRTSKGMHSDVHLKQALISNHVWSVIELEPLDPDDIKLIINKQIPSTLFGEDLSRKLLEIFQTVTAFCGASYQIGEDATSNSALSTTTLCKLAARKQMTLRDFVKFVRRVDRYLHTGQQQQQQDENIAHRIWLEAVDVFTAHMPDANERVELCAKIGVLFSIPRDTAQQLLLNYKAHVDNQRYLSHLKVGRAVLPYFQSLDLSTLDNQPNQSVTSFTRHFANLLEIVCCGTLEAEPVLLVGETGCGKTYLVQHLARSTGHELRIANMSQQTDATDLLGGYRPVDFKLQFAPLKERFEALFSETFSLTANTAFLSHLQSSFSSRSWPVFIGLIERVVTSALQTPQSGRISTELAARWKKFQDDFQDQAEKQRTMTANGSLPFTFVEGLLVKAVREGLWLLLDEINLAPQETLDSLAGLMEGAKSPTLILLERGSLDVVKVHRDFRLFACMNPATDVGKKPLPDSLRARFSEIFVPDPSELPDLRQLISDYLSPLARNNQQSINPELINRLANFYLSVRKAAKEGQLTDGSGGVPHFSIRTLCRALSLAANDPLGNHLRSLAECLLLSFLTQLNSDSINWVTKEVLVAVYGSQTAADNEFGKNSQSKFRVPKGTQEPKQRDDFILTETVSKNIEMLSRVVSLSNYPVLLQGETAVGKTSSVQYIADLSGNRCIRLNNHEHTDLSEYVGSYTADPNNGQLVFRDGPLVSAMRNGYWVILDELNLAPGEVLEALNRVLDDNREIVIPETQEVVKAHKRFRIFATQNPPGAYAGRKALSRAFRNRFIELHFCELVDSELEILVSKRCKLPPSHSKRLVLVMRDLAIRRRRSGIFAGRQGFMTLRDLFRWARRYSSVENIAGKHYDWNQHLADHGYLLLAGQARNAEDEQTVVDVLEKHFKCRLDPENRLFSFQTKQTSPTVRGLIDQLVETSKTSADFDHLVFTKSLRRIAVLLTSSFQFGEPVLLVGDTGCGKTTLCQVIAKANQNNLITLNCHLHTEAGDFIGSLRPCPSGKEDQSDQKMLFQWQDGPLTKAMLTGAAFLVDEISLADDSVLERLNSVLDADDKSLLIPERAGQEVCIIRAHPTFRLIATMNPGGDFGKRELSPALRNRFTEIFCPGVDDVHELVAIAEFNLAKEPSLKEISHAIAELMASWMANFKQNYRKTPTIRDLLTWTNFAVQKQLNCLRHKLQHGAMKAIGDGLSLSLQKLAEKDVDKMVNDRLKLECSCPINEANEMFGIFPFFLQKGCHEQAKSKEVNYCFESPTTRHNLFRLLRALSCDVDRKTGATYCRPILLEGPPGVGKTSLVASLAAATCHRLVRINLSEQTDLADLFGAHLPQKNGGFAWVDGPLLRAFKSGDWVLVDELNLASQPVLEGLNACLDHRRCASIPELGIEVQVHPDCRFFGAQNPSLGGGGRKNLPRSFLNRFTQVYVDQLSNADYEFILRALFPTFNPLTITQMVLFNSEVNGTVFGASGLSAFNLRDLTRWCELMKGDDGDGEMSNPGHFVHVIYAARFAAQTDQQKIYDSYLANFDSDEFPLYIPNGCQLYNADSVTFGASRLKVTPFSPLFGQQNDIQNYAIHAWLPAIECMTACCNKGWMVILYGDELSGKTSAVRFLARMAGRQLTVLAVTPSLDATDLLGSYEQVGWQSQARILLDELFKLAQEKLADLLLGKDDKNRANFVALYEKCRHLLGANELLSAADKDRHALLSQLAELRQILATFSTDDTEFLRMSLRLESIINVNNQQNTPSFVWSDSALVAAMRSGDWLLVDNANFCSPAVLDRLNSLFENGGELYVHERGTCQSEDAVVRPHQDFRIFLTANPKFGELSRAVRNRGIEIFLPSKPCSSKPCAIERDLNTIARLRGLDESKLVKIAKDIYIQLAEFRPVLAAKTFADLCTKLSAVSKFSSTATSGVQMPDLTPGVVASSLVPVWRCLTPQQCEILRNLISNQQISDDNLTKFPPFFHWKLANIYQDLLPLQQQNFDQTVLFLSRFNPYDVELRAAFLPNNAQLIEAFVEDVVEKGVDEADIFWSKWLMKGDERKGRQAFFRTRLAANRFLFHMIIGDAKPNALWNLKSRLPSEQNGLLVDLVSYCQDLLKWLANSISEQQLYDSWVNVNNALLVFAACRCVLDLLCQSTPPEWLAKLGVVYRLLAKNVGRLEGPVSPDTIRHLLGGEALALRKTMLTTLNQFGTGSPFRDETRYNLVSEIESLIRKQPSSFDRETRLAIFQHLLASNLEGVQNCLLQNPSSITTTTDPALFPLLNFLSRGREINLATESISSPRTVPITVLSQFFNELAVNWDWLDLVTSTRLFFMSNQPERGVNLVSGLNALIKRWSSVGLGFPTNSIPWLASSQTKSLPLPFYLAALLSPSSVVSLRHVAHWQQISSTFKSLTWFNTSDLNKEESASENMLENILRRFLVPFLPSKEQIGEIDLLNLIENVSRNSQMLALLLKSSTKFAQLFELFRKSITENRISERFLISGAFLFAVIVSYLDNDPANIVSTRLAVTCRDLSETRSEFAAFDRVYIALTGKSISQFRELNQDNYLHPRCLYLEEREQFLEKKAVKLKAKLAYRPSDLPFDDVTQFLTRVRDNLLSADTISRVFAAKSNPKNLQTIQTSFQGACRDLGRMTLAYPDLLIPVQLALNVAEFGLSRLVVESERRQEYGQASKSDLILSKICNHFMSVPNQIDSPVLLRSLLENGAKLDRHQSVPVLLCFLQFFAECPGRLSLEMRLLFVDAFSRLLNIWRQIGDERRQNEAINASLYRFRVQTHCDDPVTDEEKDEADVKRLFPDYDVEFEPKEDEETKMTCDDQAKSSVNQQKIEDESDVIDCSFLFDILKQYLFGEETSIDNRQSSNDRFFQFMFQLIFDKKVNKSVFDFSDSKIDFIMSGCLFTSRRLKNRSVGQPKFDFYFGSEDNSSTAEQLLTLRRKISAFLADWPEHPQLAGILRICDVVLDMPAESTPPAKILAGLERVYEEAQIWEQSAGKANSLNPELGVIIATILDGRKRQLDAWSKLLDGVAVDAHDQACPQLMKFADVVFEQCQQLAPDFSETCVAFLESCQVGEFRTRLDIVRILSRAASLIGEQKDEENARKIANILANIAAFYQQFDEIVEKFITDSRKPIEAELKEFVNISRWNDANFWRVRTAVHQAHKKLARARRQFAEILVTPISRVMTADRLLPSRDPNKTLSFEEDNESDVQLLPKPELFTSTCDPALVQQFESENPSLPPWPQLLRVAHDRCMKSITTNESIGCGSLNNLSEQILATFNDLSSVDLGDRQKDEAKFEKNVKSLQQQKLRALTDLFHKLTDIGISYRTGLATTVKNLTKISLETDILSCFECENVEILRKIDRKWWRLVGRFHLVDRLIANPHDVIGPRLVERARGSVGDFCQKLFVQRRVIAVLLEQCSVLADFSTAKLATENEPELGLKSISLATVNAILFVRTLRQWILAAPEKIEPNFQSIQTPNNERLIDSAKSIIDSQILDTLESKLQSLIGNLRKIELRPIDLLSGTFQPESMPGEILTQLSAIFNQLHHLLTNFQGPNSKFFESMTSIQQTIETNWQKSDSSKEEPSISQLSDWLVLEQKLAKFTSVFCQEIETLGEDDCEAITKIASLHQQFSVDMPASMFLVRRNGPLLEMTRPFVAYSALILRNVVRKLVRMHLSELRLANIISSIFASLLANGLCLPSLAKSKNEKLDVSGDGACELVDIQDGGFGEDEGQGQKDVSKKIESSDQIEDLQGQQGKSRDDDDDYVKPDDDAIEMPDDLDSKVQDDRKPDDEEGGKKGDDDREEPESTEDLDKKMGDAGSEASEDVDVEFWQGENEEEDKEKQEKRESDKKTSKGEKQSAPELGAADSKNKQSETGLPDPGDEGGEEEEDPNRLFDEPPSEADGEKGKDKDQDNLAEMAEDLCLDENEKGGDDEQEMPLPEEDSDEKIEQEIELNLEKDEKPGENDDPKEGDDAMEEREIGQDKEDFEPGEETEEEKSMERDVDAVSVDENNQEEEENEQGDKPGENESSVAMKRQQNAAAAGRVEFSNADKKNRGETSAMDEEREDQRDQGDNEREMMEDQPQVSSQDKKKDGRWAKSLPTDGDESRQQNQRRKRRTPELKNKDQQQSKRDQKMSESGEDAKRLKTVNVETDDQPQKSDQEEEEETGEMDADAFARMNERKKNEKRAVGDAMEQDDHLLPENEPENKQDDDWWQSSSSESENEKNDKEENKLLGDEVSRNKRKRLQDRRSQKTGPKNQQPDDQEGALPDEDDEIIATSSANRPPENRAFTNIEALSQLENASSSAFMMMDFEQITPSSGEIQQPNSEAETMWNEARQHTEPLAAQLCERLRAILEPSVNSKFKGDFRSGKRLNVRRLVAYAASGGRRDRIWLRRCEPGRRRHRVLLAVDDSHSMSDCRLRRMAVETLSLLAGAFSLLEIGELAVCSFGEQTRVLQPFADPFVAVGGNSNVGGAQLVSQMKFDQSKTGIAAMIAEVGRLFLTARMTGSQHGASNSPAAELLIILTDGRGVFAEGQSPVRRAIRALTQELSIFPLVLVLDNPALPDSIFDIRVPVFSSQSPQKKAGSNVQIVPYLDMFPFPFYVVVRDLNQLPEIVADALTQWIDMVQNKKAE